MFAESMLMWLFAVIVVSGLFWIVVDSRKRREISHIPGPRMYPIIGNLFEFVRIRRGFHDYLQYNNKIYGPIFRLRFLFLNFVIISDVEYAKTLLMSGENLHQPLPFLLFERWIGDSLSISTGNKWRNQRRMIEPLFTNSKLRIFIPSIIERCEKMCKNLERFDGGTFDLYCTAQDIIAKLCYDNILGIMLDDPDYKDVQSSYAELLYLIHRRMLRPWLWNDFIYSFTTNGSREKVLVETLPNITMQAILKKKGSIDDEGEIEQQKNRLSFLDYFIEYQKHDSSISNEDIRTQLDSLITAIMNTTGLALCMTLYFIASIDHLQDKIREEITSIFPQPSLSKEAPMTIIDQLSELKFLESVFEESLRLPKFPPFMGRLITEEMHLGNYAIPVGTTVMLDTNTIHHDEKYYSTPDQFNPEHFYNRDQVERRPRYAFLPFGGGLRRCVGEKYAKIILKLIIVYVVRNFRLKSNQSYETLMNSLMMSGLVRPDDNFEKIFIHLEKIATKECYQ